MKTIVKILFSILFVNAFGNAAQPGIYNSGGAAFSLLYPEDSVAYKQVQMQSEIVLVQLYKGFAAVKGHYVMNNTSNDSLAIRMGYPINGIYESENYPDLQEVFFDSLSAFQVFENGQNIPLHTLENVEAFAENWLVWETQFSPNEIIEFEVYFIVNTNDARVREGYNSEQKNVFMYLFESGSTWKQPIEQATLSVQLLDGLQIENVLGLSNPFNLDADFSAHYLFGTKQSFEPKAGDNLIIAYGEHIENFDFSTVIANKETIYSNLRTVNLAEINAAALEAIAFESPFKVKGTVGGYLPMLLFGLAIWLPYILLGIFLLIAIYYIYRKLKAK